MTEKRNLWKIVNFAIACVVLVDAFFIGILVAKNPQWWIQI